MGSRWTRRAFVGALLVVAAVAVGSGSAGPRAAEVTFDAFPGPGEVTYGELIAYRATFENTSGSTLTKVKFRQRYPVASGTYATPVDSTCPSTPTTISTTAGPEWVCDFGTLDGEAPEVALTVVWRVLPLTGTSNCAGCLVTNGRWTVKEGTNDVGDPNDAFPPGGKTVTASLLASGSGGSELLKAGGYETAPVTCDTPTAPGNLRTNPAVGIANPVATTVCLPPFPITATDLGHATTITETSGNAQRSEVCIAALGTNCGDAYLDATFGAPYVKLVFHVAAAALPKGFKITQVTHDGEPMTPDTCAASGDCVLLIDLDNKTKIWTIVVTSFGNGLFDWG